MRSVTIEELVIISNTLSKIKLIMHTGEKSWCLFGLYTLNGKIHDYFSLKTCRCICLSYEQNAIETNYFIQVILFRELGAVKQGLLCDSFGCSMVLCCKITLISKGITWVSIIMSYLSICCLFYHFFICLTLLHCVSFVFSE